MSRLLAVLLGLVLLMQVSLAWAVPHQPVQPAAIDATSTTATASSAATCTTTTVTTTPTPNATPELRLRRPAPPPTTAADLLPSSADVALPEARGPPGAEWAQAAGSNAAGGTGARGPFRFDFDAAHFVDDAGNLVPLEAVQQRGMASLAKGRRLAGYPAGEHTMTRLDVGGRIHLGRNAKAVTTGTRTPVEIRPLNPITRTHAEGEVFQRALNRGVNGSEGVLFVDRGFCASCGANGGVGSLLRGTGLERVVAVTPDGTFLITAARPSSPVPIVVP